jgi:hypothetical protein
MTEQHLPSYERDFNSEVQQLRDIAARFERAARHCFNSKVQRLRDIVERFEWVRLYSIRRRRTARIKRFTEIQLRTREWINFKEIAAWCADESGVVPNEEARAAAYQKLQDDLLDADFEENGRSQVLYLHPYTTKARMTREWLTRLLAFKDADRAAIISQYLAYCWIRRKFFERWLAKHRMQTSPPRFEPELPEPPATRRQPATDAGNAVAPSMGRSADDAAPKGPFGPERGKLRRYEAADRELFPELEQIMAKKQKSRSAAALDLAQTGRVAGVGTPDSRAKRLAALHKRERGGAQ